MPSAILVGDQAGLPPLQQAPHNYHFTINSFRVSVARQHGERDDWRSPEVAKVRHGEHGQLPHVDPRGGRGLGDTSVMKPFHDFQPAGGQADSYQVRLQCLDASLGLFDEACSLHELIYLFQ